MFGCAEAGWPRVIGLLQQRGLETRDVDAVNNDIVELHFADSLIQLCLTALVYVAAHENDDTASLRILAVMAYQHLVRVPHGIDNGGGRRSSRQPMHRIIQFRRIIGEILQHLHAVIEGQDRRVAFLTCDETLQQESRFADLREQRFHLGIRLHCQHERDRLLCHFTLDLLRLTVVVNGEIPHFKTVDIAVSVRVQHCRRNQHVPRAGAKDEIGSIARHRRRGFAWLCCAGRSSGRMRA
jgi:hypothetical protein